MQLPTSQDIVEDLAFFDDWEQRYQYIIDLGRQIPGLSQEARTPDKLVKGCQSNVWLDYRMENGKLQFDVDSDAVIVQGLLVLVLSAYHGKSAQQILGFDMDAYFKELDLERHITQTRGNGLRAIVGKIRQVASVA